MDFFSFFQSLQSYFKSVVSIFIRFSLTPVHQVVIGLSIYVFAFSVNAHPSSALSDGFSLMLIQEQTQLNTFHHKASVTD